jgi:catechol 2,3-dioxygenase-like lactoylglutathione lyase family enzyme
MIDHLTLRVADYARSKTFYRAALAPLGYDSDGHNIEACCHKPE